MGIHKRKEREKEHRKEEILDSAQKVFFDKGFQVATMDEIADSAELSKGTLYLYYNSKEDLFLAVMMRGLNILYELIDGVMNSDRSIVRKLLALEDVYLEFFESQKNYFRMFYFIQTPQFHKQVSEEMRLSCCALTHKIWELVIDLLKKGMDDGLIRSDINPVEIVIILWSSSTALMLRINGENPLWKDRMNIDLKHTLKTSNTLAFEVILTEKGRTQLS